MYDLLFRWPQIDDNRFDQGFQEAPAWEVRRSTVPRSLQAGGGRPAPRPLDLRVPADAAVVAITGPNTGGKTVTLKTAGLAALMAKAGLYVPVQEGPASSSSPSSTSDSSASDVRMMWYDLVLADIGDSQSLQQNLSTFR